MKKLTEATKNILLSILTAAFVLLMIMALSQLANASQDGGGKGGQVESWQRTGELPTANLPTTLDLETCTVLSETEWSTTWECNSFVFGTFTVVEPK